MNDVDSINLILAKFDQIGVSKREARVYLSLLRYEGVSGYQLSKNVGIPSSKIYAILNQLVEHGLAVPTESQPVKYFPCPPDELLGKLKKNIVSAFDSLAMGLKSFQNSRNPNEALVWNIAGHQDVIKKAKEIISTSRENIFMVSWAKEVRRLKSALNQAAERGVELRIVAYGPINFGKGKIFPHRPSDYPFRESGERRLIVAADSRKATIANINEKGLTSGLWTENRGLVTLFRDFVIHEIYISEIERGLPEQIRTLVGRDWEKLRVF